MADKKLALELLINVQNGNLTLEELNQQLEKAKEQLEEIGDKGSQEFKELFLLCCPSVSFKFI